MYAWEIVGASYSFFSFSAAGAAGVAEKQRVVVRCLKNLRDYYINITSFIIIM